VGPDESAVELLCAELVKLVVNVDDLLENVERFERGIRMDVQKTVVRKYV
jgi:hypothetical protein